MVKLDKLIDTINFIFFNDKDLDQEHMDYLQDGYYYITDILYI